MYCLIFDAEPQQIWIARQISMTSVTKRPVYNNNNNNNNNFTVYRDDFSALSIFLLYADKDCGNMEYSDVHGDLVIFSAKWK